LLLFLQVGVIAGTAAGLWAAAALLRMMRLQVWRLLPQGLRCLAATPTICVQLFALFLVWFGCKQCAALGTRNLPVDDEAHLLFSCPAIAVVRQERRFTQLPFSLLQDLMCCRYLLG
jgi:hypothetical protein